MKERSSTDYAARLRRQGFFARGARKEPDWVQTKKSCLEKEKLIVGYAD